MECQTIFDSLIVAFPDFAFESYLGTSASIVHYRAFEDAVIKIQSGTEDALLENEVQAVRHLSVANASGKASQASSDETGLSFADRALKRQKIRTRNASAYIDTRFLLPTSNHVERLFSMSKRVFSPKRRSLHPRTLEG